MSQSATAPPKSPAKRKGAPKKAAASAPKGKAVVKSDHPQYDVMIKEAIAHLKERRGSSRQAILKYLMASFDLGDDVKAVNNHLKKALVRLTEAGVLNHPKGIGSNGSFKLASKEAKREKKKKSAEIDENEEAEDHPPQPMKRGKAAAAAKDDGSEASLERKGKTGRSPSKKTTHKTAEKVNKAAVGAKKKAAGTPPRKKSAKSKKTAEKSK